MRMTQFILSELRGLPQAVWREVADRSGVSYSTLEKLLYGVSKRPAVDTVEPVYRTLKSDWWGQRRADLEQARPGGVAA